MKIASSKLKQLKQTAAASSHKLQQKEPRTLLSSGAAVQTTAQLKKVTLVTAHELSLYSREPTII